MSSRKDREEAIRQMTRAGVPEHAQTKLLRLGATLHRLAEAQCNGDWPADNGERRAWECGTRRYTGPICAGVCLIPEHEANHAAVRVSKGCGSLWALSVLRKSRHYLCPDCCASEDAARIAKEAGFQAVIQGDPRGAVLRLVPLGTSREDIDSGRVRGVYVR